VFAGSHERLKRSYDPIAVRQLVLNSHYRSPLDFSDDALFAAQSGYEKINDSVQNIRKKIKTAAEGEPTTEITEGLAKIKEKFEDAMNDDLNTSVALSAIFELVRLANDAIEKNVCSGDLQAISEIFNRLGGDCLGIIKDDYKRDSGANDELTGELIEMLLDQRKKARANKDFETADSIRNRLGELGVVIKDKPEGTEWSLK
jgi:cysteinyl-tRNA synthetase